MVPLKYSAAEFSKEFHHCPAPGCEQRFPLKKTLNRHFRAIHQISIFPCSHPGCGRIFNRKDIRDRHDLEQHAPAASSGGKIWCDACGKLITKRALKDHIASQAHERTAVGAVKSITEQAIASSVSTPSTWPPPDTEIDPFVFAELLWQTIGQFDDAQYSWVKVSLPLQPSPAVVRMIGRTLRSLRRSLAGCSPANILLTQVRTISILAIVEHMMTGWDQARSHWKVLRYLDEGGCQAYGQYKAIFNDNQTWMLEQEPLTPETPLEGVAWLGSNGAESIAQETFSGLCKAHSISTPSTQNRRYQFRIDWKRIGTPECRHNMHSPYCAPSPGNVKPTLKQPLAISNATKTAKVRLKHNSTSIDVYNVQYGKEFPVEQFPAEDFGVKLRSLEEAEFKGANMREVSREPQTSHRWTEQKEFSAACSCSAANCTCCLGAACY